jgi:hypothetical protein
MAYTTVINNGEFTFDRTTRFSLRDRAEIKQDNSTEFFESLLELEGELIGVGADPAADVTTRFKAIRALLFRETPLKIEIKRGSVSEYTFDPANFVGTPKMRELVQVPTDGADHASHIRFQVSFYIRKPSLNNGNQQQALTNLVRSVTTVSEDDKLIRKIWRAKATAKTLAAAKALVLSFKPRGYKGLVSELTEDIDTNTYEGVWTWEKNNNAALFTFSEDVLIQPSGHPWIESPVVGEGNPPAFHKGRFRAGSITITRTLETEDPNIILQEPPPHLTDSGSAWRDRTKEPPYHPPVLVDPVKGRWVATFNEFYWFTSKKPPTLNHSGHDTPFKEPAPGNGRIGGA